MTVDAPEKTKKLWRELADRLVYASGQNKINWQDTSGQNTFIAPFGKHIVLLERYEEPLDVDPTYIIRITNRSGETIDRFTDWDIDKGTGQRQYFSSLGELYRTLLRKENGADETVLSIINMLPDPDEIPF